MSKHDQWKFRIRHAIEAIERINEYTLGIDVITFCNKRQIRDAVERNFEIVGEVVGHIPDNIQEQHQSVPWKKMKSLRNFIIHQYNEVEEMVLWNTIKNDLPSLLVRLRNILEVEND